MAQRTRCLLSKPITRKRLTFTDLDTDDNSFVRDIEDHILVINQNTITMLNHNIDIALLKDSQLLTLEQIQIHAETDSDYQELLQLIHNGFPSKRSEMDPKFCEFWEV